MSITIPTAEEIVSQYLYGQKTLPSDLKSADLIRQKGDGEPISVDMNEFMTTGGGRFVKVEDFRYVRNFLGGHDEAYLKNGQRLQAGIYSPDALLKAYNKNPETDGVLPVYQYNLGVFDEDYADRAYVFGSMGFKINDSARFIVHEDGSREIQKIAVEAVKDNFDYKSDNLAAIITNWITATRIDPSGIGRKVPIVFNGNNLIQTNYTR